MWFCCRLLEMNACQICPGVWKWREVGWRLLVFRDQCNSGRTAWKMLFSGRCKGLTGFMALFIPFPLKFLVLVALSDQVLAVRTGWPVGEDRREVTFVCILPDSCCSWDKCLWMTCRLVFSCEVFIYEFFDMGHWIISGWMRIFTYQDLG